MSHDREAVWAVVTPVYEDGDSFASLCRDLARLDAGATLEILAVDDGSIDAPRPWMRSERRDWPAGSSA